MRIIVNGNPVESEARTIAELVRFYKLESKLVMVESDGDIVERDRWEHTPVCENQRIELVHFVGGG